jgi:Holliday junction resolvase
MASFSPYRKGRRFEYLVRDELLKLGLIVFRTAKSSGRSRDAKTLYPPVDLIVFAPDGRAAFVECKATKRIKVRLDGVERLPGPYFVVTPDNLESVLERVREWAGGS